ncbi:hypothetical protein [Pararhizobium haloflavum]|uniref:hypothetical protein n=1 Tax=Pararhizobium haloflavum TaxID=2037914 RepID=UPI000C19AE59|nr:hypothetical protein [Pararhizobium haloflavum]
MTKREDDLETLLRERLKDPRAMTAALSINANRVFLTFGGVARNGRVVLQVKGDDLEIVHRPEAEEDAEEGTEAGDEGAEGGVDPADEGAEGATDEPVDPSDHTKDELIEMAEKSGVEVKSSMTKAEIAEAINAK